MKLKRVYGVRQKARDVLSVVEAMDKARCTALFARHTSHVTRRTSHVTHHTSHVTLPIKAQGGLPEVGVQFADYDERQVTANCMHRPPCVCLHVCTAINALNLC